ncbi:hypothetical protein, partial [Klebsiella pneumoniae]|uniref:hypothetical protein n=1 Tax=Klebsiella pneumoniae TaxID=573 RepID=UPI001D0DD7DE
CKLSGSKKRTLLLPLAPYASIEFLAMGAPIIDIQLVRVHNFPCELIQLIRNESRRCCSTAAFTFLSSSITSLLALK